MMQSLKIRLQMILAAIGEAVFGPAPTSAADDVAAALAGFTSLADTLEAAADKAGAEIADSWERIDAATAAYEAARDREYDIRMAAHDAVAKAEYAAEQIRALVGA